MAEHDGSYLAEPPGAPPGAGVLVVHDWYGLLPHVRTACDELAGVGLVAVAPDLYHGRSTTDPGQAEELMEALDEDRALARLEAAVEVLRRHTGGGPVAGLGFSMGGDLVLRQATTGTLEAVAVYYATLGEQEAARVRCPVLLQLAEDDEWDPHATPERFEAALRAAGTPVEVRTWPGTEHSFANGDVPLHAPAPASEAWSVTLGFLRRHLRSGARPGRP
jgi:carboxymethylenebutenolidase